MPHGDPGLTCTLRGMQQLRVGLTAYHDHQMHRLLSTQHQRSAAILIAAHTKSAEIIQAEEDDHWDLISHIINRPISAHQIRAEANRARIMRYNQVVEQMTGLSIDSDEFQRAVDATADALKGR